MLQICVRQWDSHVAGHHSPLLGQCAGHVWWTHRSTAMVAAPQMASKSPSTQEGHHRTGHNTAHCSVSDQHCTRSHVHPSHWPTMINIQWQQQLVLSSKTFRSQISKWTYLLTVQLWRQTHNNNNPVDKISIFCSCIKCISLWSQVRTFSHQCIKYFIGQSFMLIIDPLSCGYLIIVKTNNGIIKHKLLIALTKASIK